MVNSYISELKQLFGDRIICLLFYGSRAFPGRTITPRSDYDFCLVLNKAMADDLRKLRQICLKHDLADTTLHYLSELEERGWHNFQLGNHGIFSLLYLASVSPVIGENIFRDKLNLIDNSMVEQSLRSQIVEYLWRMDSWVLTMPNEEELTHKLQKYLVRTSHDMQLMQGDLSFYEINEYDNQYYLKNHINNKAYFSNKTKKLFASCYNNPTLSLLVSLKESLKNDFLKLEHSWTSMVTATSAGLR